MILGRAGAIGALCSCPCATAAGGVIGHKHDNCCRFNQNAFLRTVGEFSGGEGVGLLKMMILLLNMMIVVLTRMIYECSTSASTTASE